jgi:hypothetical protein
MDQSAQPEEDGILMDVIPHTTNAKESFACGVQQALQYIIHNGTKTGIL